MGNEKKRPSLLSWFGEKLREARERAKAARDAEDAEFNRVLEAMERYAQEEAHEEFHRREREREALAQAIAPRVAEILREQEIY